ERQKEPLIAHRHAILQEGAVRLIRPAVGRESGEDRVADLVLRCADITAPLQIVASEIRKVMLEGDIPCVARFVEAVWNLAVGSVVVRLHTETGPFTDRSSPIEHDIEAVQIDRARRAWTWQRAGRKIAADQRILLDYIR